MTRTSSDSDPSNPFIQGHEEASMLQEEGDERDVFFGTVISKEEMQVIKKRGLGRQLLEDSTSRCIEDSTEKKGTLPITRSGRLVRPPASLEATAKVPLSHSELNKLTLSNTKRNSGYHTIKIQYEDIFEAGPRPDSPTGPRASEEEYAQEITKRKLTWRDNLVDQVFFDEKEPLSKSLSLNTSGLPAKSCLRRANVQDHTEPSSPKEKQVVNVKRVYYEDDEQLQYLLSNVPDLLNQVLQQMSNKSDAAISQSTKRKTETKVWHEEEQEAPKRANKASNKAMGPPQRNKK